jgi:hypothetical protein
MDHGIDIIPISSHPRATPLTGQARSVAAGARTGGRTGLALAAATGVLILAIAALSHARTVGSIRGLAPVERSALYRRTLDDTRAGCSAPDARAGVLGDHCRSQAEFLTLFPECDAPCRQLAAAILPHARR